MWGLLKCISSIKDQESHFFWGCNKSLIEPKKKKHEVFQSYQSSSIDMLAQTLPGGNMYYWVLTVQFLKANSSWMQVENNAGGKVSQVSNQRTSASSFPLKN
jgi:hypothetical protein